jgi:proliferating cell nuclear antigen
MSFKITVEKAKTLQDLAKTIAVIVDEATLQLTPEGLTFHDLDRSNVAMLTVNMPKTVFAEYHCPETTQVSFNLTEFLKLLNRAGKDDKVTLERAADGKLCLTITEHFASEQAGKPKIRRFILPTLESVAEAKPAINLPFKSKAKVTVKSLLESVEDARIVNDFLYINFDKDKLGFSSHGDLMDADSILETGNPALLELATEAPAKACYSIFYLSEILKAGQALSSIAILELNTDHPVKIDFVMQEGSVVFVLAPRIGADD